MIGKHVKRGVTGQHLVIYLVTVKTKQLCQERKQMAFRHFIEKANKQK